MEQLPNPFNPAGVSSTEDASKLGHDAKTLFVSTLHENISELALCGSFFFQKNGVDVVLDSKCSTTTL